MKLEVTGKEIIMYEVKLINKMYEFYSEEKALEFIAENINEFVFMRALCDVQIDVVKENV